MATVAVQKELDDGARQQYLWEALTETNQDGAPIELPPHARNITVQAAGSFDSGTGSVTWQGSIDGATWFTLQDPAGNALQFSAAGGGQVANARPRYIRPLEAAGSGVDIDARAFITQ